MNTNNKLVILFFLLLFTLAKFEKFTAQLICTPVAPNLSVTAPAYTLDIDVNNDAMVDFRILTLTTIPFTSFVNVKAGQVGTNNFVMTNSGGAMALNLNTSIGPSSSVWTQMNSTDVLMMKLNITVPSGNWSGAIDKYLGLKFVAGTNTYYGWARFTFENSTTGYRFKDYAFNSSPNQPILAGQGCSSLSIPSFFLDQNSCQGYSTTVTANTGTLPVNGFTWSSNPSGPVFAVPNSSVTNITFPGIGLYTVSLNVLSGTTTFVATRSLTVYGFPTITAVATPSAICFNTSGPLQVTLTGQGAGATTYTFYTLKYLPAMGYTGTANVFYNVTPPQQFSVTGSVNGCSAGDTITVSLYNDIYFSCSQPDSICIGSTATLNAVPLSGNTYNYSWVQAPPGTVTASGTSLIITPTVFPITFSVTGYNPGCALTQTFSIFQKKYSHPEVFTFSPTLCLGETAVLTASGAVSYTWFPLSGNLGMGVASITVSPGTNTTYSVIAVDGTCTGSKVYTQYVDPCTSLKEYLLLTTLKISPNPASGICTIKLTEAGNFKPTKLELRTVLGELVFEDEFSSKDDYQLNVSLFAPGVYYLGTYNADRLIGETKLIIEGN